MSHGVNLSMFGQIAGTVTVDRRMLVLMLDADRVDGRGGRDVGKRNFDRVLDRVQQLNHHVQDVTEGKFMALIDSRTARSCLADGAPHVSVPESNGSFVGTQKLWQLMILVRFYLQLTNIKSNIETFLTFCIS